MSIDHRLDLARQLLIAAIPDRSLWSGLAANSMEQRISELLAELAAIQAGLWR